MVLRAIKKVDQVKGDWEYDWKGQFAIFNRAIRVGFIDNTYLLPKFTWECPLTTLSFGFAYVQRRDGTRLWP